MHSHSGVPSKLCLYLMTVEAKETALFFKSSLVYFPAVSALRCGCQESNASHDPIVWWLCRFEIHVKDVIEISTPGSSVDGASVHARIAFICRIGCRNMNDRHGLVNHFGLRLGQPYIFTIPASTLNVEPMDVNTFRRRCANIFLHLLHNFRL
jgi:hypothetical protein